jgi:hypothetical protein
MIQQVKKFSLKQRDFASGKMISPPREFWEKCDCCGKAIVQGYVMSNGDKVGDDCELVISRAMSNIRHLIDNAKLFSMFGTPKRVQQYIAHVA